MQQHLALPVIMVVISVVMLTGQTDGAIKTTTAGKDFFLALFDTISQPPEIVLLIDTPSSDLASYTVETATGLIATGELNGTIHSITLSNSLQVGSSGYSDRNKGIRVSATGKNPIVVIVTMKFSIYLPLGFDTYKVHENVENEPQIYEYYALSTDYNGQQLNRKSEVLLVGNHNDTIVSITPTQTVSLPEDAQNSTATLVSVAPGTTHNLTLNQFQTLLVFNPTYDITGTRIVSNKPLTVLTGHQCAQFPTSATFCEPVHVQMPPTFLWGNEFLLASFAGRTSQQQYKLVTAEKSTTIVYRCDNSTAVARTLAIAGVGDYLVFPAGSYCSLFATKPIFVVQLGAGYSTDENGDPVMAVVPPTTRHINYTIFHVNSDLFPSMTNFVSITILQEYFGDHGEHVLLDGNQLSCYWNEIYNSSGLAGYGCNISTTTGKHFITHSNNGLLSVVAYGWSRSPAWGYAFLTGMSLEMYTSGPPSEPKNLSSELVSDGVLVFSWSPPWAPNGVQLYYTVTVTNTNTSVVTVFTTSYTSITLTRDNITSVTSSSQCDQYVWSVTAVNPAGISIPANYMPPVYFKSAPIGIQTDVCINDSHVTLLNVMAHSCRSTDNINYTVNVVNTCNGLSFSYSIQTPYLFTVPYTPECTVINIIAENGIGARSRSVDYMSETVQCPRLPQPFFSANSTLLPTASLILPSNAQSMTVIIIATSIGSVIVVASLLFLVVLIIAIRQKKKIKFKGSCTSPVAAKNLSAAEPNLSSMCPRELNDPTVKTEENSAYGLIISQLPPTTHEYDQVDVLMGDTGFTMSTNTAYSVIHHPMRHQ